jgi:hypothetical protein
LYGVKVKYFIYDLETLINFFSFSGKFKGEEKIYTFELSSRKNERSELLKFLSFLQSSNSHMIGFNNLGFDYPIIHDLMNNIHTFTFTRAYLLCQSIIGQQSYGGNNLGAIGLKERLIPQIDLVKINHFDNPSKRTSLKSLQFAMRSHSVEDIPIKLGVELTSEQMDTVIKYNVHDVTETEMFLNKCMHLIDMRKELMDQGVLFGDVLNFSDVKIGTEFLLKKIGRNKCFVSGNEPKQTHRPSIAFKDVILSKIAFRTEEFQKVLDWFNSHTVYDNDDRDPPKLEVKLANLNFHFGVGGAHASVEGKKYKSSDTHVLKDVDVTGMYPSIAIVNNFYPEHLGNDFSTAYAQLVSDRSKYKKGTTMNGVLKLASNGAFGNSNNPYSFLFDPRFTKQITLNGQLQILQLAEVFSLIPGLELVQVNTDGITVYMPRSMEGLFHIWKLDWEDQTRLKLEEVEYDTMWIKDVNNYLCLSKDKKIKAKGAYWYPKEEKDYDGSWNKDFSTMVIPKVIEESLIKGLNYHHLVKLASDPFDFMLRYKTTSGSVVYIGDNEMSKTVRYYVTTDGQPMKKVSVPKGEIGQYKRANKLTDSFFNKVMQDIGPNIWDNRIHTKNKSKYEERVMSIENGRLVKCCNLSSDFSWDNVDWDYYIKEIEKIIM